MQNKKIKNRMLGVFWLAFFVLFVVSFEQSGATEVRICSSADAIVAGSPVVISYSGVGSCSGSAGTFYPGASTTYSATCSSPDGYGGSYNTTACVDISVCVPSCAQSGSYCSGTPFSDGCGGTCYGTWPTSQYDSYHCIYTDSIPGLDCRLYSNCSKVNKKIAACAAVRSCDRTPKYDFPASECVAHGVACADYDDKICSGCQLKIEGWKEVAP